MLIDGGANVESKPEMLQQFGVMGSIYMEKVMGLKIPRVGLANVGTEDHKGGELQHQAFQHFKADRREFYREHRSPGYSRGRGGRGGMRRVYRQRDFEAL